MIGLLTLAVAIQAAVLLFRPSPEVQLTASDIADVLKKELRPLEQRIAALENKDVKQSEKLSEQFATSLYPEEANAVQIAVEDAAEGELTNANEMVQQAFEFYLDYKMANEEVNEGFTTEMLKQMPDNSNYRGTSVEIGFLP